MPRTSTDNGRSPDWPMTLKRRQLPFRLRLRLPSTRAALKRGVKRVSQLAAACGYGEDQRTDLEIALMEALANAMEHGHRDRPDEKIFLRCYGGPDVGLVVAVRDQGSGFDPGTVPDPRATERLELHHGRGLLLMRSLMDHLEYRKGGREVVLLATRSA